MNKLKNLRVKAFTLVEMLVVLLIISVLMLLFVPNLSKKRLFRILEMLRWSRWLKVRLSSMNSKIQEIKQPLAN